jgi:hypothetical protein
MASKAMGTIVVALAIGALLGFGVGYVYYQDVAAQAWEDGVAYQQSITPQTYYTQAISLEWEWDNDEFDHSATIDAAGNVAADVTITRTLTIENDDDASAQVWVLMYDPLKNDNGLDSDLETDNTYVYLKVGAVNKLPLYKDGDYTDGVELGTIPAGAEVEFDLSFSLLENDDEEYKDGKTYTCYIYLWQPNANNVDKVAFTVLS